MLAAVSTYLMQIKLFFLTPCNCEISKQRLSDTCNEMIHPHHTVTSAPLNTHQKTVEGLRGERSASRALLLLAIGAMLILHLTPHWLSLFQRLPVTLAQWVFLEASFPRNCAMPETAEQRASTPGFPRRCYSSSPPMITA